MLLSNFPSLNPQEHFTRVHEVIWLYKKFKYLNVSFIIKQKCHCHINPSAICFCFCFSFNSKAWLFSTVPYTHDVELVSTGTCIFLGNGKLLMRPIFIIFFFLFLSLKHLKTADFSKTSTAQLLYFRGFICQNKTTEACFGKPSGPVHVSWIYLLLNFGDVVPTSIHIKNSGFKYFQQGWQCSLVSWNECAHQTWKPQHSVYPGASKQEICFITWHSFLFARLFVH